jgi:hypothetical protein
MTREDHEPIAPLPGQLVFRFMHAGRSRRKRPATTEQGGESGSRRDDLPAGTDRQEREGRKR